MTGFGYCPLSRYIFDGDSGWPVDVARARGGDGGWSVDVACARVCAGSLKLQLKIYVCLQMLYLSKLYSDWNDTYPMPDVEGTGSLK